MIWVISFPWTNCEIETKRALNNAWLEAEIYKWNEKKDILDSLDWYVIAWGFSFEDRWRSWVIASIYPIIKILYSASLEWKPILWICNWAQILVESWLVTDSLWPRISLLDNKRIDNSWHLLWTWFYHAWPYLKPSKLAKTAFSNFDSLMHIPLAHAQGRFLIPESEMENIQIVLQYSDNNWNIDPSFPINPNWSDQNAAAIANKRWNVMAIMPHPERSENWNKIFESLKDFLVKWEFKKINKQDLKQSNQINFKAKQQFDIEIYTKLLINDNEAISIENALNTDKWVSDLNLNKYKFYWINWIKNKDLKIIEELIFIWEFANFEKEILILKDWEKYTKYWKSNKKTDLLNFDNSWIRIRDYDDVASLEIKDLFLKHNLNLEVSTGKYWLCENMDKISDSYVLANPISQFIEK